MWLITSSEFDILAQFIYRRTGIRFEPKKKFFVSKRVQQRMQHLGIQTPAEYIRKLRFGDPEQKEFQQLLNLLTINETYFFRDYLQFQAFAEHCLPEVTQAKTRVGERSLRIWSAGCASGEEPYTIAIILMEMLDEPELWHIEIIANDVDVNILNKASKGQYLERSIRDVPPEYLQRYFTKQDNWYHIADRIKDMVQFRHFNLMNKLSIRKMLNFDFIFCRNVLIYFDDASRKQIVDHFYIALNPGGFIFLGSSESVSRITSAFKLKRMGRHLVYYK